MNKGKLYVIGFLMLALLGVTLLVIQLTSNDILAHDRGPLGSHLSTQGRPLSPITGGPAIQPTIRDAGPASPAFTVQDVAAYAKSNNVTALDPRIGFAAPPTISKIEFVTVHVLSGRIPGLDIGLPDDTLLCYVEYRGTFTASGPGGISSSTWHRAFQVFDAHTGNEFVTGTLPGPE